MNNSEHKLTEKDSMDFTDGSSTGHGSGKAGLAFKLSPGGRTYLSRQYLPYPFHATRVFYLDPAWPEFATLYLTSASGGLFQGDRVSLKASVNKGASAHITTGSATKIHGMERDFARQTVDLTVGQGAYLEYLVEPNILFPRSRLESRVKVSVDKGGCAILGDSFLTHDPTGVNRAPFDALFAEVSVHDSKGGLLALDRMKVSGGDRFLSVPGLTGDSFAQGSIYFIWDGKPPDVMAQTIMKAAEPMDGVYAGASTLPGSCGACARILADDPFALDHTLWQVAAACRKLATGQDMSPRRK
jgi:urease accessory protein